MTEWRNGGMAEWQNGGMAEWRNSGMAEWQTEWWNGGNGGTTERMAEWQNGSNGYIRTIYGTHRQHRRQHRHLLIFHSIDEIQFTPVPEFGILIQFLRGSYANWVIISTLHTHT